MYLWFNARPGFARRASLQPVGRGGQEEVMVIESRTIVGAAAAFALVGAALWGSAMLLEPTPDPVEKGSVEVVQMSERSWAVEIKDLGTTEAPVEETRTAANR
jgi:hypothetical protein